MRPSRAERSVVNLVKLLRVREVLKDNDDVRAALDQVVDDLLEDAGQTLTKAAAARVLGISRPTLNKWIAHSMVRTVTVDGVVRVERQTLQELALEVDELRHYQERHPGIVGAAVARLEFAGMEAQIRESLAAVGRGELVPLRIPDDFGPED